MKPEMVMDLAIKILTLFLAYLGFRRVMVQLETQIAQLKTHKKIEKSKFILALTTEALKYSPILTRLEEDENYIFTLSTHKEKARSFIRFTEAIMLLVEEEAVTIEEIFPILGYRILSFLNHKEIRKALLKQGIDKHAARFCGAYALYERLFSYLLERFPKKMHFALKEFKHEKFLDSLYWDKNFTNAVNIYYEHKKEHKNTIVESNHIVKMRELVENHMSKYDTLD